MAELRRCARCRSEIQLKYFAINRKGEYNKTCETCLNKIRKIKPVSAVPSDDDNVSTTTPETSEPPEQEPPKTAYRRSIPIDATDVGALLGLNKYKTNLHEIVMKYWERGFPVKFRDTRDKLEKEGIQFVNAKAADEQIMDVCEERGISIDFDSLDDVDKLMKQLDREDDLDVDAEDITSFCNKQMGIQFEKSAIELYEKQCNVKVDSVGNYVKRVFKEDGLCNWMVGGRVDGVIGFDRVIEIKNRKKGFYPNIPIHEVLQLCTYMFAMNINKASLVEMYGGDIKESKFIYTSGYETYALSKLKKFCSFMEQFIDNAALQEQFMKCSVDDNEQVESINEILLDKLDIRHMRKAKITPIKNIVIKPATNNPNDYYDMVGFKD